MSLGQRNELQHEVWSGLRRGLGVALSCCGVFVLVYLIRGTAGIDPFPTLFSALAACLVSGAVGGFLFGFLFRWRSSILGRAAVGAIVTAGVVLGIGYVAVTPDPWWNADWKAVAAFSLAGAGFGAVSMLWRRRPR